MEEIIWDAGLTEVLMTTEIDKSRVNQVYCVNFVNKWYFWVSVLMNLSLV